MHMHICMCIHMYVCTYVHICKCVYIYICIFIGILIIQISEHVIYVYAYSGT